MEKAGIRIQTVSQWQLLKQLNNNGMLRKKRIPDEVMRVMFRILHGKTLGKEGFIVLCPRKICDDFSGIEDLVGLYPYRLYLEENMDEIVVVQDGKRRLWSISYARVRGQKTRIAVIYKANKED